MKKDITNINLIIYITLMNLQKEKKFFLFLIIILNMKKELNNSLIQKMKLKI